MVKLLRYWWLPALFICLPLDRLPSAAVHFGSHSATLHLSQFVALAGIILFGADILRRLRISVASPYFWMAAYGVIMLLSVAISLDKARSVVAFVATVLTMSLAVIVGHIVKPADLPRVQRWLFGVTIVVALFGIYQFIGDSFGLSNHLTGLRTIYTTKVFGFPRVQSTELEPLFFANYLLLPTLLTAALLVGRARKNLAFFAQLLLFGVVLSLTLSRGGIIGALFGLVAIIILLVRLASVRSVASVILTVALSAAIAIGAIFIVTGLAQNSSQKGDKAVSRYVHQSTNLQATDTSADSDRVLDRRLALQEFRAHPLLGGGIGSFGTYAQIAAPKFYPTGGNRPTVNDEYYEVLAETGIAGAVVLVGLVVTLLIRLYRGWRRATSPEARIWLAALIATGGAYAIQYYAFSTLYIPHIWVTIGLMMALTAAPQVTTHAKAARRRA